MSDNKKGGLIRVARAFAIGTTITFQFAASVLLGLWLGHFLDQKFGTEPWLMLLGLLLGIAAGTMAIYRIMSRFFS